MEKKNHAGAIASNAGDDFHLIWACKKLLETLRPNSELTAISVEGPTWTDSVQISDEGALYSIAVLLHTMSVNVRGILDGNELPVRQLRDVFHHRGHGKMYRCGNCAVAGVALMRAAILTVEQVGVDGDGPVTDIQKEQFIGQREKILVGVFEYRNHVLIHQSATVEFGNPFRSHVLAHVQLECDFFRTG